MTEDADEHELVAVESVERIERGEATRPWSLDEMTVRDIEQTDALHRRLDTVYVPWGAQEPVDDVTAVFTVDHRVLDRGEQSLAEAVTRVAEVIEGDPRLDDYVIFDKLTARAEAAEIDEGRTRVRLRWTV